MRLIDILRSLRSAPRPLTTEEDLHLTVLTLRFKNTGNASERLQLLRDEGLEDFGDFDWDIDVGMALARLLREATH